MGLNEELKDTLTLILAGGTGSRLKPLTLERAKPAVPFGGAYRIIDFALSNCIHSGLRRIYLLTQYQARSLEEHIRFGWNFLPRRLEQFISVSPPHYQADETWYRGTADAIYHNLHSLREDRPKNVLILSGDHIYKMDYRRMLREHLRNEAALTMAAVEIPVEESSRFGVLECNAEDRVVGFEEKPERGRELPGVPGRCRGSMGIYIFETRELVRRLQVDAADPASSHDFGKDVIPAMIRDQAPVFAHTFVEPGAAKRESYWRDVGTIDAYYEANLDMCRVEPSMNLYDQDWPIYTLWHNDPPAKTVLDEPGRRAEVHDSLLCPGVIVSGAVVRRSILSNRCHVQERATVEDSILLRGVVVGQGARVRRAIIDKWVVVPTGVDIGYDEAADRERFTVTDSGIVVVPSRFEF